MTRTIGTVRSGDTRTRPGPEIVGTRQRHLANKTSRYDCDNIGTATTVLLLEAITHDRNELDPDNQMRLGPAR